MTSPKLTVGQKAAKSVVIIERKLQNAPFFKGLIIATFFLYLTMLVFNFLAINPTSSGGLFTYGTSNVLQDFPLGFTPAGWGLYIWGVICLLQLTWMIYSLGLICRSTPQEEPAYLSPVVLSPTFFIFFNLSSAFNIGWLFLWDKLLFLASFVFLACIALSLLLTITIASSRLAMFRNTLIDQDRHREVKFLQIVVTNSIAMYATWSVIIALANFGIILTYKSHNSVSDEGINIMCFGILAFLFLIYIGLDLTVIEGYTRYCMSPYAVIIWAVAASITQNYNPVNMSSIMSLFLLGAVLLVFFIKLGITIFRSFGVRNEYRLLRMGQQDDTIL